MIERFYISKFNLTEHDEVLFVFYGDCNVRLSDL